MTKASGKTARFMNRKIAIDEWNIPGPQPMQPRKAAYFDPIYFIAASTTRSSPAL